MAGLVFLLLNASKTPTGPKKVNLVIWSLYDTPEDWQPLIDNYKKTLTTNKSNPEINITVVKKEYKSLDEYQQDFTNAIADGKGPDILMIKNDWLSYNYQKLTPMPESVLSKKDYEQRFLSVVTSEQTKYNFNSQKNIYGVPLSVDTLILIYNVNQFGQISQSYSEPAKSWEEFVNATEALTKRDGDSIVQSGVALGTSNNIPHSSDIVSLLMLQNGTQMVSDNQKEVYFNRFESRNGQDYYPGTAALKMYTDFASKKKQAYSWNSIMPNALNAFIQGKTSMIFGYSEDLIKIVNRENKSQFNIATAQVPQIQQDKQINYVSFWMYSVSKNSQNSKIAWDFLTSITNIKNISSLQEYYRLKDNLVVSSLADIAKNQQGAQYVGPMAKQLDTSESWYKGDALKMDNIFSQMITSVNNGQPSQASIDAAAKEADKLFDKVQGE